MNNKSSSYRWVIAIMCFMLFFVVIGLGNMPNTLYTVPVTNYYNFSRGEFSIVFSIITITGLVIQFIYGYLVKRIGLRVIISLGLPIMAIGHFIFSRASTLSMFYIGAAFVGIGFNCSSLTSVSILIKNWFSEKQQGTMLGFIAAGSGLGGSLFLLIVGQYIINHGFHASFLLTSIVLALAAIPVIIFIRSEPCDETSSSKEETLQAQNLIESPSKSEITASVLKQPHTFLALIAVLLIGIVVAPINHSIPAHLIDNGFDVVFAAQIASAIFFVQAISKILLGWVNDRFGNKTCLNIGLGSFIIGTLLLIFAKSRGLVWVCAFFSGIAISIIAVLVPLYVKAVLEKNQYEQFIGMFIAILFGGISVGDPIINYSYDLIGNYRIIFVVFIVIGLASMVLSNLSLNMKAKLVKELEDINQ